MPWKCGNCNHLPNYDAYILKAQKFRQDEKEPSVTRTQGKVCKASYQVITVLTLHCGGSTGPFRNKNYTSLSSASLKFTPRSHLRRATQCALKLARKIIISSVGGTSKLVMMMICAAYFDTPNSCTTTAGLRQMEICHNLTSCIPTLKNVS